MVIPRFALDVHPVQVLGAHRPLVDDPGELQHPGRQRGFELQNSPTVQRGIQRSIQQGIKIGMDVLAGGAARSHPLRLPRADR